MKICIKRKGRVLISLKNRTMRFEWLENIRFIQEEITIYLQSFNSCPYWPHNSQGRGWFGTNSSLKISLASSSSANKIPYLIMLKLVSWVASPSMIKSASAPHKQWTVSGLWDGLARCFRMKSMILCSPSPGAFASDKITCKNKCMLHFEMWFLHKSTTQLGRE